MWRKYITTSCKEKQTYKCNHSEGERKCIRDNLVLQVIHCEQEEKRKHESVVCKGKDKDCSICKEEITKQVKERRKNNARDKLHKRVLNSYLCFAPSTPSEKKIGRASCRERA